MIKQKPDLTKQITVRVPNKTHTRLKILSVKNDIPIQRIIADFLEGYIRIHGGL